MLLLVDVSEISYHRQYLARVFVLEVLHLKLHLKLLLPTLEPLQ